MIGIVGAMSIETEGLIACMTDKQEKDFVGSVKFVTGKISGQEVVVCTCGIGKVFSSVAVTALKSLFPEVSLVINLGVAGGIGPMTRQGDIVVGEQCVQHDFDQTAEGLRRGQIPGLDFVEFDSDRESVAKMTEVLKKLGYTYHTGLIASGDVFVNSKQLARSLNMQFGAIACDMESGAVAHVCHILGMRFISMRAISDNGNDDAVGDFYAFVEEASKRSIKAVKEFLALV